MKPASGAVIEVGMADSDPSAAYVEFAETDCDWESDGLEHSPAVLDCLLFLQVSSDTRARRFPGNLQ